MDGPNLSLLTGVPGCEIACLILSSISPSVTSKLQPLRLAPDPSDRCCAPMGRPSNLPEKLSSIWRVQHMKWRHHTHLYIHTRLIMPSGSEELCYFLFLNAPSFVLDLPICFCCFNMGGLDSSCAWVLPQFSSDLNFKRSIHSGIINPTLHPSISPLSSLHWRALPSLFHRELFNIMRALLLHGTHPSVLHEVWQQLLQTMMEEREAGHQWEMEKEVNLSSKDWTSALISPQKPGASFLDNTQFIF